MVPPPAPSMSVPKLDVDIREVRKADEVNIINPHIGVPGSKG